MSLRASQPDHDYDKVNAVYGTLKNAPRGKYCSRMQPIGKYYNAEDKFDIAELVFKDPDIDSLEVLKCFVETMNLTLYDALGQGEETLLFPAVQYKQLESVKHLA